MKSLWFVSGFFLMLTSCSNFICRNSHTEDTADRRVVTGFFDKENVIKFRSSIGYKTSEISGILILKKISDTTLAGGFINEFGIKGFDFVITKERAKLGYVIKTFDKWYIRRNLETGLHFMFYEPKLLATCSVNDSSVYVADINRSLHYVYHLAEGDLLKRADMYKRTVKKASLQLNTGGLKEILLKMRNANGSLNYEFYEIKN
jgi:hypothetical protein